MQEIINYYSLVKLNRRYLSIFKFISFCIDYYRLLFYLYGVSRAIHPAVSRPHFYEIEEFLLERNVITIIMIDLFVMCDFTVQVRGWMIDWLWILQKIVSWLVLPAGKLVVVNSLMHNYYNHKITTRTGP